jgi:hypothetical protein
MATVMKSKTCAQIVYFESEGRQNLAEVVRILKRQFKRREELRSHKIVIFTAFGEGPSLVFDKLSDFSPKIIAVTFPRTYSIARKDGARFYPKISESVLNFFRGVGIEVIVPPSLPLDAIDGMDGHNQQVKLVSKTLAMFGAGFGLCVQAVLRACDMGYIQEGDSVIAMSGDIAGLFVASTTSHFLNNENGLSIEEIFCKPRRLTISRPKPAEKKIIEGEVSKPQLQS